MDNDTDQSGNAHTNGDSTDDTPATQARVEPLAPAQLWRPELLILGMTYKEYQTARAGFFAQLIKTYREGLTIRQLAAACGVKPRDIKFLLQQGVTDEKADTDSLR